MNRLLTEYKAVCKIAGVSNVSADRSLIRVSGNDRTTFLHGQCTNEIKKMRPGDSCYAAFLTPKGKMRGAGHIICLDDFYFLNYSATLSPLLENSLNKYIITEDVAINNVSEDFGELTIQGSRAAELAEYFQNLGATVFKNLILSELGFNMIVPKPRLNEYMDHCLSNGAQIISTETLEVLRVESGLPKWGVDMDENTIPIEAGLTTNAISYDKGCYIGQETIARIKTYGHVNRHLVQMGLESDHLPNQGEKIHSGNCNVGHVTSYVKSVRFGKGLALGYVKREQAVIGAKLVIGNQTAEVLKLCCV